MVQADSRAAAHAEVLRKVFDLGGHGLSRSLAEDILSLDLPQRDAERVVELSAKAKEAYINVGDLLAFWQSKARQALHQA
jgi:hypothetical protein